MSTDKQLTEGHCGAHLLELNNSSSQVHLSLQRELLQTVNCRTFVSQQWHSLVINFIANWRASPNGLIRTGSNRVLLRWITRSGFLFGERECHHR